ncbi:MAG: HlyD family efflux transporter periplasmic adaptor subunit [Alphaproteobacteria bacterium]|nr:HlyD family efflux transporter periplasmic adaptor subunit [Alphaproteobacteria bacterium]
MKRASLFIACLLFLAGCDQSRPGHFQGYGEADYLFVASEESGRLLTLEVREGDKVEAGQVLFQLNSERMRIAAQGAAAAAESAKARVDASGALSEAVRQAEANADLASKTYSRSETLFERGFVSKARLDADRATLDAARAAVAQAQAERDAAARNLGAVRAEADLAEQRVSDTIVRAPQAGSVERIYHRLGEVVAAGTPVLALLPPENLKVRFFVPEGELAAITIGDNVGLSCDGCAEGLRGRVTFIETEPQFTPPVIYSLEERAKLMFLVEARPETATGIRPGLPVDVRLFP